MQFSFKPDDLFRDQNHPTLHPFLAFSLVSLAMLYNVKRSKNVNNHVKLTIHFLDCSNDLTSTSLLIIVQR